LKRDSSNCRRCKAIEDSRSKSRQARQLLALAAPAAFSVNRNRKLAGVVLDPEYWSMQGIPVLLVVPSILSTLSGGMLPPTSLAGMPIWTLRLLP
jgi:hypothetical protein